MTSQHEISTVSSPPLETYKDFKLIDSFQFFNYGAVYKYRSTRTGLYITLAKISSPIMKAYMTLRTRPSDHDGIPHVLEHMVFLGSQDYPFKGLLDKVANRCFAQGTNAFTQSTNTTFELTTAGTEGFYRLLPVYLDHILYPSLTDSGFLTEIHHIDGNGQDSGVVYNEMLGRENSPDELIYNLFNEVMYDGSEGYQYNYGGKVANLRELTVEKVRKFHHEYYSPKNFNIIVVGNTTPEELIDAVQPMEQKILSLTKIEDPMSEFTVWKTPLPPLTQSVTKEIVYPSDDETSGHHVVIGWRAAPWKDLLTSYALDTLWNCLTVGDIAPLRKELVENESGDICCADLYCGVEKSFDNIHRVWFLNVEADKVKLIVDKFFDFMRNIKIDLDYLRLVINRDKLDVLRQFETNPHETFSHDLIEDFLYSTSNEDCRNLLDASKHASILLQKDEQYWKDLIETYILKPPFVALYASPSSERVRELSEENMQRLEQQKKALGEQKLKELEERLAKAELDNARSLDQKTLEEQFPIPSLAKIEEIHVATYRNDNNPNFSKTEYDKKLEQLLENHTIPLPFFFQLSSIPSQFVDLFCMMDSSNIPLELKMYIPLFLAVNFSCDLKYDDQYVKKDQVIMSLMRESVSYSYGCGYQDHQESSRNFHASLFAELLQFRLTFEIDKYHRLAEWTKHFLHDTIYTPEIIETKIQVLLSEIPLSKVSPEAVMSQGLKHMLVQPQSNHNVTSFLLQEKFLNETLAKLKTHPETVIDDLNRLRNILNKPENIRIHVVLDVNYFGPNNYKDIMSTWASVFNPKNNDESLKLEPYHRLCKWTNELTNMSEGRGILLGMGSADSGNLIKTHRGITNYELYHDRHALSVAINFLTMEEGPFWVKLRGKGLCYGSSISSNVEKGTVSLYLSRVSNISKTFAECKAILEAVCSDDESKESVFVLNENVLNSARATVIVDKLHGAETIISACQVRFLSNTLFGGSKNFYDSLQDIGKVTVEDVKIAIKKYILPLFRDKEGTLFICDNIAQVKQEEYPLRDALQKIGYLTTYHSLKEYLAAELGITTSYSNEMSIGDDVEGSDEEDDEEMEDEEQ
ncbi:hypothetical protein FDP41_002543 [Naegleria fowleri]|uniref:Peptidase M16C associated domain-containing protein n=1 Tax=Naegleria fowleri TaxID=5763 RepID=A0A6A5BL41_NAEFO|nr:uncharacterized protein FDP41_002543 [Naegleria fowleri]KAF0978723.1 hypothetical protein FDP41_002543 [Naegleria fowleri]